MPMVLEERQEISTLLLSLKSLRSYFESSAGLVLNYVSFGRCHDGGNWLITCCFRASLVEYAVYKLLVCNYYSIVTMYFGCLD